VPCEYLSVDVSDMTGLASQNISKDILKWRLDAQQSIRKDAGAQAVSEHREVLARSSASLAAVLAEEEDAEPLDANLSQPLSAETFLPFLKQHELSLVNFYAPWCIWCQRLEPVYLETASKVPSLHFHGHTRLAQVDCVAHQDFCVANLIRAYPTLRMYKVPARWRFSLDSILPLQRTFQPSRSFLSLQNGQGDAFELFTGERKAPAILEFIQTQMANYQWSDQVVRKRQAAKFEVKRGALSAGADLYRAKMPLVAATTFCGNNEDCVGFTWSQEEVCIYIYIYVYIYIYIFFFFFFYLY